MPSLSLKDKFVSNLKYAVIAQVISFLLSFFLSIIVPKFLGVEDFAYWQLFVFYSCYVGICHMGMTDGVYLRYGGKNFTDRDKENIVLSYKILIIWLVLVSIVSFPLIFVFVNDLKRRIVWFGVLIYIIVANSTWYWGYVFQALNETAKYSKSIIISKVTFIIFLISMFLMKCYDSSILILFFLIAQIIALVYLINGRNKIFKNYSFSNFAIAKECFENIRVGIKLTISNIVSGLIIGNGRAIVDASFGISKFGILSLSISVINIFIQAINAVSMVMFPALRTIDENRRDKVFDILRNLIDVILLPIFVLFVPAKCFLALWLPEYKESLVYMGLLLPICLFDGKMQLLLTTYMKVCRLENKLLAVNTISFAVSTILCSLSAKLFQSIDFVIISITFAIYLRYVMASVFLSKSLQNDSDISIIFETLFVMFFYLLIFYGNNYFILAYVVVVYFGYIFLNREKIVPILMEIKK